MNADEFKRECARRRDAGLVISGDTYMVRGGIKAEGGIWDARLRGWLLPDMAAWCRASALVASQARPASSGASTVPGTSQGSQNGASAAQSVPASGGGTASPDAWTIPVPVYQGAAPAASSRVSQTPQGRRGARPCGYPGCNPPAYCDECEGEGAITEHRRAF